MADYRYAVNKPDRTLINYNAVRAAELKAVYESLVSDRTVQNIISDFVREKENNVRNCIDFLHAVDLVERAGDDRVVSPLNRDIFPELSFEARLLYHLRQQPNPNDHLTRIQTVALGTADRSLTIDLLLPQVKSELDHDLSWNETKLRMWRDLSAQLGLVSKTDSRGTVLSPCRRLLYDLLDLYEQQEDETDLERALSWIEEHFFDVFETTSASSRVHPAISDVLQNMESEDVLELRGMSDAKNEVTLPEAVHTQRSRAVNVYDLEPMPESSAYQYPLAQFEQVIPQ